MQSLEKEAIVWQEAIPPRLDSTTTIGMESGDSSVTYPPRDDHMTFPQVGRAYSDLASFPGPATITYSTPKRGVSFVITYSIPSVSVVVLALSWRSKCTVTCSLPHTVSEAMKSLLPYPGFVSRPRPVFCRFQYEKAMES